jgi:pectin methylesterase-like acyl-CoA thioesterase
MRKINGVVLILFFIFTLVRTGVPQNVSSVALWPLLTDPSVQVSGPVIGYNQYITNNLVYGSYAAQGTNYYTQRIKMLSWPTNQLTQIDSVYIQFKVSPQANYTLQVDSLVLSIGAVSTQDMMANLYYSKDSTFGNRTQISYLTSVPARVGKPAGTFLSSSKLDTIRATVGLLINQGESFYFRVYPWVDSSTSVSGKYVALQNVTIYATAVPVPVQAFILWPLVTDQRPVINGLLSGDSVSYGSGLRLYGFDINGAKWTTQDGSWPAESSPDSERYAQVCVSPLTGATFVAHSLSFQILAEHSKNLRMRLYYSNDSLFKANHFVVDTSVSQAKTEYSFLINDTANSAKRIYVRFYPYDVAGDTSWEFVDIDSITITGFTTGLAVQPPSVQTTGATYVSTTYFTATGNVSADGGSSVTDRGFCWNTTGMPTVHDSLISVGTGIGSFSSRITRLSAGVTYHVRAYATNLVGTSYGNELTVTTLSQILAPTVATNSLSSVLATTAICGGNVMNWGGDSVIIRGVCWNTTGNPTTSDNKTNDGSGIGSFVSGLTRLKPNTTYHVRAYAVNGAGVGYGNDIAFTTRQIQPDTTVVVAQDGTGDFTSIQAAFDSVPYNYTGKWIIFVKKGIYHEKDTLVAGKSNVELVGEDKDSTIIRNDDYGDKYGSGNPGTVGTFTVAIDANDFIAKNITIQNTYSPQPGVSGTQAVALRVNGDRQEYINCKLLGFQDTYYTWGGSGAGRIYMKDCFIEGSVDFIFGRDIVVFDSCTLHEIRNGGTLTAASTDFTSQYGYVFRNCTIIADSIGYDGNLISSFYLGRPWQSSPRTVFLHCYEPTNLSPAGWLAWNVNPATYGEYKCYGQGSPTSNRVRWSTQLTDSQAAYYNLTNIFSKTSASSPLIVYDWMPSSASQADNFPIPDSIFSVQLESFGVLEGGNGVTLTWRTNYEINNAGFLLLRKGNGDTAFTVLSSFTNNAALVGEGTGTMPRTYTYADTTVVDKHNYVYKLQAVSFGGQIRDVTSELNVLAVMNQNSNAAGAFTLNQNYPNPFNPSTTITYRLTKREHVTLKLYDVLGREVATLVDGFQTQGFHSVVFNGTRYASGVYFYRLAVPGAIQVKKMLLEK